MNCYYHTGTTIVAKCQDCSKGLCKSCTDKFNIPICHTCNDNRGKSEKDSIIYELLWILGLPFFIMLILASTPIWVEIKDKPLLGIILFYNLIAIVTGWIKLNRLTSNYFLFLPLIGWGIYFCIKVSIAGFIGFFVTPFFLFKKIKRLYQLNKIY